MLWSVLWGIHQQTASAAAAFAHKLCGFGNILSLAALEGFNGLIKETLRNVWSEAEMLISVILPSCLLQCSGSEDAPTGHAHGYSHVTRTVAQIRGLVRNSSCGS